MSPAHRAGDGHDAGPPAPTTAPPASHADYAVPQPMPARGDASAPTTKSSESQVRIVDTLENTAVISCLNHVRDPSTVTVKGEGVQLRLRSAATARCSTSTSLYTSIPFRLAGSPPASSPNQPDHVRSITRIRGAGEPEQEGALLRREGAPCRQLPLPPEPSTLGPAVEAPLSEPTSPSPRTLGFHGYMGLGEAGGGSAPQPLFEHVEGFGRALGARSEQTPLTDPALLTEQALPDQSILGGLVAAQAVTLADLSASGVALFFVATLVQPLVFAHVNGFEVLGAELPIAVARSTPMRLL